VRFQASPEELRWLRETIALPEPELARRVRKLADAAKNDANAARGLCLLAEMYENPSAASTNTQESTMFKHVKKDARHFSIEGDLFTPGQAKEVDPVQARVDRFLNEVAGKATDATAEPQYSPGKFAQDGTARIGGTRPATSPAPSPMGPYAFSEPTGAGTLPADPFLAVSDEDGNMATPANYKPSQPAAIRLGNAYQFNVKKGAPGADFTNIVFGEESK
jgi:hypothetical protein